MTISSRYESVPVEGDHFDAYCAVPAGGDGPGVLLLQEVFGINDNMRALAGRLAEAGYVVLVPDMFWRLERRFESRDESGMPHAFKLMEKFDFATAATDLHAAHAHLSGLPECTGKVGVVGFCLGGGLAFLTAATSRVEGRGVDAAVCYYGSAINDMLDSTAQIQCPMLFHYGSRDSFIPAEKIAAVEAAVSGRSEVEFYRYEAGHAFSNEDAPSFYNSSAAAEAWPRTLDFFARHLRG